MKVFPSILTDSLEVAQKQLDLIASIDQTIVVQIDIIDGYYADNVTLQPTALSELQFHQLQADLHLMVNEPIDTVFEAREVGHLLPIRAVLGQIEHMSDQGSYLSEVRRNGWQAGLSLDLYTPAEEIDFESWQSMDLIQIMTIQAGFQGQQFVPHAITTVKEVIEMRSAFGKALEIVVDGGIKEKEANLLHEVGVDSITVGSLLWNAEFPENVIQTLQNI